ncbi:MAG: ATP-binding cassette domain-containing protein [Clostridia bacterium]|nr:ATP-binding cassette domain-containing protein [Clostridia bacterium]
MVGEKGVKLSGGQKQRVLIARALMRNKPIMIFDNAFSKLDKKTSDKIFQNLKDKYPQTTMIFITHKSNIENYVNRMIKLEEKTSEIQNTNTN